MLELNRINQIELTRNILKFSNTRKNKRTSDFASHKLRPENEYTLLFRHKKKERKKAILRDPKTIHVVTWSDKFLRPPNPTCMLPVCYLYVTYMLPYVICTLPVCYLHATCMLPVRYLYVTCMLPVCYLYVTCMLPVCYLYATCMLPVCYLYVTCMLPVCYLAIMYISCI